MREASEVFAREGSLDGCLRALPFTSEVTSPSFKAPLRELTRRGVFMNRRPSWPVYACYLASALMVPACKRPCPDGSQPNRQTCMCRDGTELPKDEHGRCIDMLWLGAADPQHGADPQRTADPQHGADPKVAVQERPLLARAAVDRPRDSVAVASRH